MRSSAVRSIGYDEADWMLQVELTGGKICNFYRVPPEEHARLMRAPSIGAYFKREIKPYYSFDEEDGTEE